jgi:ATP-dependent exoDNAse (exonuclease V) beta subunit
MFLGLRKVFKNASFSIFGDIAQGIYSYQAIDRWEDVLGVIGDCELMYLKRSYRTSIEIMQEANKVLSKLGFPPADNVVRHGEVVDYVVGKSADVVKKQLEKLNSEYAHTAIICKSQGELEKAQEDLKDLNLVVLDENNLSYADAKNCLLTTQTAKGLEFDYIYVVGCEENLFPSQRALETVDGIEEERRLFYVALTRAKRIASLSCAEMRFKWGNMEFSRPSRFLSEIDEQYLDSDFDVKEQRRPRASTPSEGEGSAIDALRRRFDFRYQQKGASAPKREVMPKRESAPTQSARPSTPTINTDRMRRIENSASGATTSAACAYTVGERVEHPRFGRGRIVGVEPMATDHKLIVEFDDFGQKTLIAKLAKLTKI